MKCIKDQCRSPMACNGFGYCRELNMRGTAMIHNEKEKFIIDLISSVTRDIVKRIGDMPVQWDGHELRRYIADKFAEQISPVFSGAKGNHVRKREYRNDVIIRNL